MLPYSWGRHGWLRELYGSNIDSIADATLQAFFKQTPWDDDPTIAGSNNDVRYFAHALARRSSDEESADMESASVSREIDSPGEFYDEAFRIVYWAARHRLKDYFNKGESDPDWLIAVAYLRSQRFRVLRLIEFLEIHRSPYSRNA